ncbi:MAG TPA: fimbrial biogenesis outer membrane usher protein, partial [Thermoanaerobaculia bacterium]
LVRVPGVRDVRVYLSNQLVGRTDQNGDLLVPNLLPYYGNRIRIDDRDVPMTHDLQIIEQVIAPPTRGGALVLFPAHEIHAATGSVIVRTGSGEVIPAYGQIRLATGGEESISPIGGQGDFYFENVSAGSYEALVEYEGGTCSFTLTIPASNQEIADIGRVVCEGTAP